MYERRTIVARILLFISRAVSCLLKNFPEGKPEVPTLSRHGHEAHGSRPGFRLIGRATIALWLTPVESSRRVEHGTAWHGTVDNRRVWTIIYSEWDANRGAKVVRPDRRSYIGFSGPRVGSADREIVSRISSSAVRGELHGRPRTRGFVQLSSVVVNEEFIVPRFEAAAFSSWSKTDLTPVNFTTHENYIYIKYMI